MLQFKLIGQFGKAHTMVYEDSEFSSHCQDKNQAKKSKEPFVDLHDQIGKA